MLRYAYWGLILICIAPILPGLAGVLSSALGYLPVLGSSQFSWQGFYQVWQWQGVEYALLLSISSTLLSTYLSLLISFSILQRFWFHSRWQRIENSLSLLLALPHVAFAIGFAFLFSSSGWLSRLLYGIFEYQDRHQEMAWLVHDPYAIGLTVALALKEVPFILLISLPILQQFNLAKMKMLSASLGYSEQQMWWKILFPQWLRKIRFTLFAVAAYGISVVDFSLVLGPTTPPTFSVLVWQWFNEPDLSLLPRAASGAVLLLLLASFALLAIWFIEWLVTRGYRRWQSSGRYSPPLPHKSLLGSLLLTSALIIPLTIIWSVAQRWRYPDFLPTQWTGQFWQDEWPNVLLNIETSVQLALCSGTLALLMAILAQEYRLYSKRAIPVYFIALPMLLPQLSLLLGLQVLSLMIASNAYTLWVVWAHTFFAFPLVYLALSGPWQSYNPDYSKIALSLGKNEWQIFLKVKLPLLFPALLYAWAVGISVSLAQYLPTLMLGSGRLTTITTEAVALSSGYDRRVTAIYAICQAVLPFVFFSLALLLGRVQIHRHRAVQFKVVFHDFFSRKPRHP
ncbi:ABC transporter permease [Vibrio sp. RC586]|uniref:ABC transporter permease n=1 Tax=Vibrio sp. RC586 TaxID=675815 RepID=UPI000308427D|nr:ABC transporter permease [Vibrio sp. RC586]